MSIEVKTTSQVEVIDITNAVQAAVRGLDADGLVCISAPHTTAGLLICEADDKLLDDFRRVGETLVQTVGPFTHDKNDNPNAEAHILSAMVGSTELVPVTGGKLDLGTYQHILFYELDGPRERRVEIRLLLASHVDGEAG